MHIVLINPEYPSPRGAFGHGGIATYTYTLADALCAAGHKATVLVKAGTQVDSMHPAVTVREFEHRHLPQPLHLIGRALNGDVLWEQGFSRAARDLVLEIHRHDPVDAVEFAEYNGLAWAFRGALPFALGVHFHTPTQVVDRLNGIVPSVRRRRWYRHEVQSSARAHGHKCPSLGLRREAAALFGIPEEKIAIIRNPVSTAQFDKIARPAAASNARIDLLFAGRLERRKGAEALLSTAARLLALDSRVHLTFAGETDLAQAANYREAIERTLSEAQRHRVWFLGPVNHDALPLLYRRSSIFLFPSLFENAPYALFEAMIAGLPVVAADVCGVSEIIRHGENGLLFAAGDHDAFVECVARLIREPALARRCAERARADVESANAPLEIARQTVEFYQEIRRKRGLRRSPI